MPRIGGSPSDVGVGTLWIEPDRLGAVADRIVELAVLEIGVSGIFVHVGIIWVEPDEPGELVFPTSDQAKLFERGRFVRLISVDQVRYVGGRAIVAFNPQI